MIDINSKLVQDDLDIISEIFNPVDQKTIKFEEGENRVVSVLFLDVKGFTSMSEKMNSEEVKSTMDKILTVFTNSILKFGGYIDKYEGDLIMALFGSKITTETDTERAIDAGLKILSNLKEINNILDIELAVRIGINTGVVTTGKVGMKREGDFTVYGDAVNLASRMETNAPLNSIMIPKGTKDIIKDHYIFENLGKIDVKGKSESVEVYKVISKKPKKIQRWERNKDIIKKSSYVGREKEMDELLNNYSKVRSLTGIVDKDYIPSVIGIKGEAGIGKSRLVKEFIEKSTYPFSVLSGYTLSYAQPVYNIWTTMLKSYFNIENEDSLDKISEKLERKYLELIGVTGAEETLLQARNVIAYMFGVKYDDVRLENFEPEIFKNLFNVSVRHTLEAISYKINVEHKVPLLIYFDDCQWIDEPSLNLLKHLLDSINIEEKNESRPNKNFMFILTYRPEFKNTEDLKFNSNFTELEIHPLTVESSKELIYSMIGNNEISDEFIEHVMKSSHGNPFYIEELICYLIENEKIIYENGTWVMTRSFDQLYIPLSLNSVILSRIDNLSLNKKALLQRASVIGHHFFRTILDQITNKINDTEAIEPDFSFLERDSWVYNYSDDKYLFKHILTSEICYRTILMYNKKILHRLIAETTEDLFGDNKEFYAFIANHYEKSEPEKGSYNYRRMLTYMEKAGYSAQQNFQNKEAIAFYDRIIQYLLKDCETKKYKRKLSETYHMKGTILEMIGDWDNALVLYEDSKKVAEEANDEYRIADINGAIGLYYAIKGDLSKATALCEDSLKYFNDFDGSSEKASALDRMATVYCYQGKYQESMELYNESKAIYKKLNDEKGYARIIGNIGVVYKNQGDYKKALECLEEQLEINSKYQNREGNSSVMGNIGVIHYQMGNYSEAIKYYQKQLDISITMGNKRVMSYAIANIGELYRVQGDTVKALEHYNRQMAMSEQLGDKPAISNTIGNIGVISRAKGNFEHAIECYEKKINLDLELNNKQGEAMALSNLGEVHNDLKEFSKAIEYHKKALKISLDIGAKWMLPHCYNGLAQSLYGLHKYEEAQIENEKCHESSKEMHKDLLFMSNVLREKINFKISNDIQDKTDAIEKLKALLKEQNEEDNIAMINFEIAKMLHESSMDNLEYKDKAIELCKKLYKENQYFFFPDMVNELEREY